MNISTKLFSFSQTLGHTKSSILYKPLFILAITYYFIQAKQNLQSQERQIISSLTLISEQQIEHSICFCEAAFGSSKTKGSSDLRGYDHAFGFYW